MADYNSTNLNNAANPNFNNQFNPKRSQEIRERLEMQDYFKNENEKEKISKARIDRTIKYAEEKNKALYENDEKLQRDLQKAVNKNKLDEIEKLQKQIQANNERIIAAERDAYKVATIWEYNFKHEMNAKQAAEYYRNEAENSKQLLKDYKARVDDEIAYKDKQLKELHEKQKKLQKELQQADKNGNDELVKSLKKQIDEITSKQRTTTAEKSAIQSRAASDTQQLEQNISQEEKDAKFNEMLRHKAEINTQNDELREKIKNRNDEANRQKQQLKELKGFKNKKTREIIKQQLKDFKEANTADRQQIAENVKARNAAVAEGGGQVTNAELAEAGNAETAAQASAQLGEGAAGAVEGGAGGAGAGGAVLGAALVIGAAIQKIVDITVNTFNAFKSDIEQYMNTYAQYQSNIATRLQGSVNNFEQITDDIRGAVQQSPLITQKAVIEQVNKLADAGIAFNIEERAFLSSIADRIATTFDVANGTLLRIVRIQAADSTSARLGMESSINKFLNSMFEDTSYLTDAFDTVTDALFEATSTMSTQQSAEFENIVQRWLGSLYSIGMSSSAVQTIAQGIGYLGSGNVSALAGNTQLQTLMAMSASKAGLDYAEMLTGGITLEDTNDLLKSMVEYLGEIATDENQVVKSEYANLLGLSISDIRSVSNLAQSNIESIYDSATMAYNNMLQETTLSVKTLDERTALGVKIDNLLENTLTSLGTGVYANPGAYSVWRVGDLLNTTLDKTGLGQAGAVGSVAKLAASGIQLGALAGSFINDLKGGKYDMSKALASFKGGSANYGNLFNEAAGSSTKVNSYGSGIAWGTSSVASGTSNVYTISGSNGETGGPSVYETVAAEEHRREQEADAEMTLTKFTASGGPFEMLSKKFDKDGDLYKLLVEINTSIKNQSSAQNKSTNELLDATSINGARLQILGIYNKSEISPEMNAKQFRNEIAANAAVQSDFNALRTLTSNYNQVQVDATKNATEEHKKTYMELTTSMKKFVDSITTDNNTSDNTISLMDLLTMLVYKTDDINYNVDKIRTNMESEY